MSSNRWLTKLAHRVIRVSEFLTNATNQHYTNAERLSLVGARKPHGREAHLLKFHVSFLNEGAYQILLREIFFKGEYFFEAGTDSPVILDCGANIGMATLYFKYLYPKARISSFEADPETASALKKNIEQNHLENVSVYNLMLSNTEGVLPFYTGAEAAGIPSMSGNPKRTLNHREIHVKAGKISSYIEGPIDLLKLDVEGGEWDVMADLKESGKIALVQRMVIEYHHMIDGQASCFSKFLSLLEDEGFEYQLAAQGCDPISRQGVYQDILIGAYRPKPV